MTIRRVTALADCALEDVVNQALAVASVRLLAAAGLRDGQRAASIGPSGGIGVAVLRELVGPSGHAVEFRVGGPDPLAAVDGAFDLIHARSVLACCADPVETVLRARRLIAPGGVLVVEELDVGAAGTQPPSAAHRHLGEMWTALIELAGHDPALGWRLPALLRDAGLTLGGFDVVQPTFHNGAGKRLPLLVLDRLGAQIVAAGLSTQAQLTQLARRVAAVVDDPTIVVLWPRVARAWARDG
jgi:SAM-dependent methyltransferase